MRIAHFSDPHLLRLEGVRARDWLNKRWLGGVNLLSNRGRHHRLEVFEAMVEEINRLGVDHVVCTGDITNVAIEDEFRFAREKFDTLALGTEDVTVIPGNHDAYVAAGLSYFDHYFGEYCGGDSGWEVDGAAWPRVRIRGSVAIVLLSTSHPTPWLHAYGRVGDRQLDALESVLTDERLAGLFRLVLIHHPPAGHRAEKRVRGLRDHRAFAEVIASAGAELVLHGHEHRDLKESLPGPGESSVPVHGIQSASYEGTTAEKAARFRVYDVGATGPDGRPVVQAEHLYAWNAERQGFENEETGGVGAVPAPA